MAATVAQANPDVATLKNSHTGKTITVDSSAVFGGGVWTYTYDLTGTHPLSIDGFTIDAAGDLGGAGIVIPAGPAGTGPSGPGIFQGTQNGSEVTWDSTLLSNGKAGDLYVPLVFTFTSTQPPANGYGSALDGGAYDDTGNNNVVVPQVPDGGLTVSLLGGALLGLGALRRKLGC